MWIAAGNPTAKTEPWLYREGAHFSRSFFKNQVDRGNINRRVTNV